MSGKIKIIEQLMISTVYLHNESKKFVENVSVLKGHNQLAHMRIRYHFIANLHITETRSILF